MFGPTVTVTSEEISARLSSTSDVLAPLGDAVMLGHLQRVIDLNAKVACAPSHTSEHAQAIL